jgi:uncharacterized Zn-binding protein involved in type VI secretion
MPGAARVGDTIKGHVGHHANHMIAPLTPCNGHDVVGVETTGVPNVRINGRPAIVVTDGGTTNCACDGQGFTNVQGSSRVRITGRSAVRIGDRVDIHGQGTGTVVTGSANVRIGG